MSARNVLGINLSLPPAPSDHLQHPPDHLLHVATLDVHLDNFILPNVRRRLRLIPGTFLADTQNLSSIERFINKLQTYCPLMLLSPALNPPSSLMSISQFLDEKYIITRKNYFDIFRKVSFVAPTFSRVNSLSLKTLQTRCSTEQWDHGEERFAVCSDVGLK